MIYIGQKRGRKVTDCWWSMVPVFLHSMVKCEKFSNLVSLRNVENYIQDYQCNKALSYQYLII